MGLGSEIQDPDKTYSGSQIPDPGPGVKKALDAGSGFALLFGSPYPDKQQPAQDAPFLQYTSGILNVMAFSLS
jgi:hypothetical protein